MNQSFEIAEIKSENIKDIISEDCLSLLDESGQRHLQQRLYSEPLDA